MKKSENKADGKKEGRASRKEEKWFDGSLMKGQQRWRNYSCQRMKIQATSVTPPTLSRGLELRSQSCDTPSLMVGLMGFSKDRT